MKLNIERYGSHRNDFEYFVCGEFRPMKKHAQEDLRQLKVAIKEAAEIRKENETLRARLAELKATRKDAEKLKLLGEMRDGAVIWFSTNPHGWPDGTRYYAAIEQAKGGACKTCNGEGGWESAASSTSYFWTECPACVNTKGGVK